jgi:hypothetical protein
VRPRHAFLVRERATIAPLEQTAADSWFLGGTLHDGMRRNLERCGLAVERVDTLDEATARAAACPDGAIVSYDSVAASRAVIAALVAARAKDSRPALAAALPEALSTTRLAAIGGLDAVSVDGQAAYGAPLWALRPGAQPEQAEPVLLPFREQVTNFPLPPGMLGQSSEPFAATGSYLVRVDHWAHVLRVNLSGLLALWFERWQSPLGKLWFLARALLGFPWRGGRLAESIRLIHRKANVHHRAHVELSIVEAGATIGANAVVKNSYIARDARIDDGAQVNGCVVGAGAFVANASAIFSSLLCPGSFAAQQKMQFSVLGERSVAFTGSYFYDLNFERNVQVAHRGHVVDSGSRFLSVCLGPLARIAGGVWIASGREVPARALIVQPPGLVAHKLDPALAQSRMTTIDGKTLVDAGAPLPSNTPAELKAKS